MRNFETGEKLIEEAQNYYLDLLQAYRRKSWNTVVRRAQEIVELSLKGLLKIMGVEYPKVHDVGWLFEKIVQERSAIKVEQKVARRIREISANLARERSPAFYMEKSYDKAQADEAKKQAEEVLNWTGKMKCALKKER